jgi:predicted lipid carrier protein YhbT
MDRDLPTPVHLLRLALNAAPRPVLDRGLHWVMRTLRQRHPALFRRLGRLAPATILFAVSDTPHCFLLSIADDGITLGRAAPDAPAAARITGTLQSLLWLMEGRVDSDTLFFSRDVAVSGDTAVAVGFRNTLDGETISLLADALAATGPLEKVARRAVLRFDARLERVRGGVARWRNRAHRTAHGGHDPNEATDALVAEVESLRGRVAGLEAARRRREGPA